MTVYRLENDAIEGERIVCTYCKRSGDVLCHYGETHKGTRSTLSDAYCVITKPLRSTQNKK